MHSFWKRETGNTANLIGLILLFAALAAFGYTLLATAWMSDDAYITWRSVENLVNGDGPRWNVAERVQSFTHPLWMLLNAAVFAITGEGFLTWIAVSLSVSLLAVLVLVFGLARNWGGAVLALVVLLFSRGFMDYCTSGLENPLTYLLMGLFLLVYFRLQWGLKSLFLLSLLAGLATLNRMDTILFFLPPLAYAFLSLLSFRAIAVVLAGFLPFIAWELFSLVYYGFPFPNTAYAKLGTGIPSEDLLAQGIHYFAHTWARDPGTLVFMLIGIGLGFFFRERRHALLLIGALLYLVYIAKIGGDFMGGRFFGAPLFIGVVLLSRIDLPALSPRTWVIAGIAIVLSLSRPFAPITTGPDLGSQIYAHETEDGVEVFGFKDEHGIGDERRFWYQQTGLLAEAPPAPAWAAQLGAPVANTTRALLAFRDGTTKPMPSHKYAEEGRQYRATGEAGPKVHGSVGFRGFFGGPSVFIIDYYALADPLLARIPAKFEPRWRIGHFARQRPAGYEEAALGDASKLRDPGLQEYYAHLLTITRGPLFSADRWKSIIAMNLGRYDHLINEDALRFPNMRKVDISAVSEPKAQGARWDADGNLIITPNGLEISLGKVVHNSQLEVSFDNKDMYMLLFFREGRQLGERIETMPPVKTGGLALVKMPVPLQAVREGYDTIRVFPYPDPKRKDEHFSMGHLKLD